MSLSRILKTVGNGNNEEIGVSKRVEPKTSDFSPNINVNKNKLNEIERKAYLEIQENYNYIKQIIEKIRNYERENGINTFLDCIDKLLMNYISTVGKYMIFNIENLNNQEYHDLVAFLKSIKGYNIEFAAVLVNKFLKAGEEELFPVIKFLNIYAFAKGYLASPWGENFATLLSIIDSNIIDLAKSSDEMYSLNPISRTLDNKDDKTTELALNFYVDASKDVMKGEAAVLAKLKEPNAFDNYIMGLNNGKKRTLDLK